MENNSYKNDYREHVRYQIQRRVNILMTDVPKIGNIENEIKKIFKGPINKNFLK